MQIALFLAPPATGRMPVPLVETLRRAWGGTALDWLAPGVAVEFGVPAVPDGLAEAQAAARAEGVDLALIPAEGRRKRLLIADMDSTMIGQECIDELADLAGVGDRVAGITARAMAGELDFEAALVERVSLLAGLDRGVIDRVLSERITLAPGGPALVATMRAHGARTALISGGFVQFTEAVAARLGMDEHRANRLIEEGGRLTGDVARPILGRDAKVAALHEIAARDGIPLSGTLAVGDGANDLGMIAAAGLGVALHAKLAVAAAAPVRIDHGDLTALLYLQGYRRADFAE